MFFKKKIVTDENKIKGAILGAIVGDAMGVPFECVDIAFGLKTKEDLKYVKPKEVGMWSDDSSMILCLTESLLDGYNLYDIADSYRDWLYYAKWTPQGVCFDCGRTTSIALKNYNKTGFISGLTDEKDSGNGSLMRIMPLLFYVHKNMNERFELIEEVSAITHNTMLCKIGCAIYIELALNIYNGFDKINAYKEMQKTILNHYKDYPKELEAYHKILKEDIWTLDTTDWVGHGFIVPTLECALYSFMTTKNYKECITKAIRFSCDTDTIASIAGGLMGLELGDSAIPNKWINGLARKEDIDNLLDDFYKTYKKRGLINPLFVLLY